MTDWIIPFRGRNSSGAYSANFLWSNDNIYIMDNHKLALWCWLRHMPKIGTLNLLHVDRHTDTLYSRIDSWLDACPEISSLSISEYDEYIHQYEGSQKFPLFRWDNYMSLFSKKYGHRISRWVFATHHEGDKPRMSNLDELESWQLPGFVAADVKRSKKRWIVNIDLDYFTYHPYGESPRRMFSTSYLQNFMMDLRALQESDKLAALTIALSPECCGGWESAEEIGHLIWEPLGVDFSLPDNGEPVVRDNIAGR